MPNLEDIQKQMEQINEEIEKSRKKMEKILDKFNSGVEPTYKDVISINFWYAKVKVLSFDFERLVNLYMRNDKK